MRGTWSGRCNPPLTLCAPTTSIDQVACLSWEDRSADEPFGRSDARRHASQQLDKAVQRRILHLLVIWSLLARYHICWAVAQGLLCYCKFRNPALA
jgi:hypothetical protein